MILRTRSVSLYLPMTNIRNLCDFLEIGYGVSYHQYCRTDGTRQICMENAKEFPANHFVICSAPYLWIDYQEQIIV